MKKQEFMRNLTVLNACAACFLIAYAQLHHSAIYPAPTYPVRLEAAFEHDRYQDHTVKFKVNHQLSQIVPDEYQVLVVDAAVRHGVEPMLLAAVVEMETGGTWNPNLRGSSGEYGLMQIMPGTTWWIAKQRGMPIPSIMEPEVNLDYGAWYLAYLLRQARQKTSSEEEAVHLALREYNGGPQWRERAPQDTSRYAERVLRTKQGVISE